MYCNVMQCTAVTWRQRCRAAPWRWRKMVTRRWSGSSVQSRGRHTGLMLCHCGTLTGYCYNGDNSFTISALSGCLLQTRLCVVSVQTSPLSKHTRTGLHVTLAPCRQDRVNARCARRCPGQVATLPQLTHSDLPGGALYSRGQGGWPAPAADSI